MKGRVSHAVLLKRLALVVAVAIALSRSPVPPALPIALAQPPTASPSDGAACTITALSATTDRAAVPIGGSVRLDLTWRWQCTADERTRDVLIVADPWGGPNPARLVFVENVRLAYGTLADHIGWRSGNRFGTVSAACPATVLSPMAAGETAHAAWRDGIARLAVTSDRGLLGGLRLARDVLLASPIAPGAPKPLVVVFDVGFGDCASGAPASTDDLTAAAQALRDAGAIVAVVASRSASGRLQHAADPGWYFHSATDAGTDLPAIAAEIAERTVVPGNPSSTVTRIALATSDWDIVGSAPPADVTFPEVQWFQPVARRDAGDVRVSATLRARPDAITGSRPLAVERLGGPSAIVVGPEGDLMTRDFDAPSVCIFRPGRAMKECGVGEPVFMPLAER